MKAGFTIVEVLVAVLILTVLTAFSIPTYQLILAQLQLNSAVTQATDFVRLASQKTVTEQQTYAVQFRVGSATLTMVRIEDATTTTVDTTTLPTNIQISSYSFAGDNKVRFTTAGAPVTSGSFTVRDQIRNKSRLVEVRPSGNIRDNAGEQ